MDTDFEDLVADTLRRRAEAVMIPPGLTGMADRERRRLRQRRVAFVGAIGAATAVGTAATVVAMSGGAQQVLPAQTTAYVVSRTEDALARDATRSIQYVRMSWSSNTSVNLQPVGSTGFLFPGLHYARDWYYGDTSQTAVYGANGKLAYGLGVIDRTSRTTTLALLYYPGGTWRQFTVPTSGRDGASSEDCAPAWPGLSSFTPSADWSWGGQVRHVLGCGLYAVAGHRIIDGVDAIELTPTARDRMPGVLRATIWVNRSTYLPVQILIVTSGPRTWLRYDFTWLPASRANLAKIRVRIPAGFRREGPPQVIRPSRGEVSQEIVSN
jgi:hypothetical protein